MRRLFLRLEPALYALWAAILTLASARSFYGYMLKQTGGEWSAPLDDVFIHFDYARATALGHPFEWVAGNGYSSGNTSLSYPFVLALGYVAGFRGPSLMVWAAIVAATCTFGALLAARLLFLRDGTRPVDDAGARAATYLAPPMLLGVGALAWSLWSGMEVAAFLGTWALGLAACFAVADDARRAPLLGAAGALLVVTRPEGATTIAAFGVFAATALPRRARLRVLAWAGGPAVAVLAAQAVANRALTGEWSANGAIVKLAVNNPFLTPGEKYADWAFNLRYTIFRNLEYHFADAAVWGPIVPALALLAVAVSRTRAVAALLWAQIVGWCVIVALNGQVRWQNERYTMPAVAWLLLAAALGAGALARPRGRPGLVLGTCAGAGAAQLLAVALRPGGEMPTARLAWPLALLAGLAFAAALQLHAARALAVAAALVLAHTHQAPKMRDQRWFFGRASRNIRDQHTTAGRFLAKLAPRRVLVGDAGALLYASEAAGLDLIGLGGFADLPFARAGVHGLAASLELIERIPAPERPDFMAIYPTWWGVLPTWFASEEVARFPAEGNVICGGYEKVIYKADWSTLGTGDAPRALPDGEVVKDTLDVADLVSEREHRYELPAPGSGWTDMKILSDPHAPSQGLFDGGRRIASGRRERFVAHGLVPGRAAHVIVRSAPEREARVRVRAGGADVGDLHLAHADGWVERGVRVGAERVTAPDLVIELANEGPDDFVDYHVWVTQ